MTRSDAIVRRQLLKAGLIVAGVPFCPEALFDRRAAADDEKPAEDAPIGPREIIKGLDGMSRVADKGKRSPAGTTLPPSSPLRSSAANRSSTPTRRKRSWPTLMPGCSRTRSTRRPGRRRPPTRGSSRVCSRTSTPASPHCAGKATTSSSRSPASRPSARCPRPRRPSGSTACGRWSGASGRRGAGPRRIPTRSWASMTSRSSSTSFSRSS